MMTFPQLSTGSGAQYPFRRTRIRRTVRNRMADGRSERYLDSGAGLVRWSLPLEALSNAEISQFANFFEAAQGRLRTFTFLDPAANLLAWSEDLSRPVWSVDPMIQHTAGVADPQGTTRATRLVNAGQAAQGIRQTVNAPGSFAYCFSAYVHSETDTRVTLSRSSGDARVETQETAGPVWRRIVSAGTGGAGDTVTFALEAGPGAVVDVFGLQVEAQPAPSEYMATRDKSGVYPTARFDSDALEISVEAINRFNTTISIVSRDGD